MNNFEMEYPLLIGEDTRTYFQKFAANVVKAGNIPKHVAVIMDGNRRYSKAKEISFEEGYLSGLRKLSEVARWAFEVGIQEVTMYVFSIENFKRPEHQKCLLFRIFKDYLEFLLNKQSLQQSAELNYCIQFIGDISLIPEFQKPIAKVEAAFNKNGMQNKFLINIAFAYTARNEIARASLLIANGVRKNVLKKEDLTIDLMSNVIQLHPNSNPVDLMVRTSNTRRLSDYLLWQSSNAVLHFVETEWPEVSFWDLWFGIFKFQRSFSIVSLLPKNTPSSSSDENKNMEFIESLRKQKWGKMALETSRKQLK